MRKNIKLYIADKEVDCSENISLPMTYTVEDFNNPTIVKNSFSKTISIPGTANNNKIFGEIYKLDRLQHYKDGVYSGIYFNPSKRVDFQIYNNGYLVESGYMQLNTISIKMAVITYNITLYGGLGDFFYNLKYKEDGTIKTLADIRYFIEGDEGLLPEDKELDFQITKETVYNAFYSAGSTGNRLLNFLTFIPSYNGVYENFDNDTCLINTNGTSLFPTSVTDNNLTYTPYNGYGLAKLEQSFTEWQIRDLRSYMQRPAIKLSKLIESICRKENSGYDVIFDESFFNDSNPYWSQTYLALPLLGSSETEEETVAENTKITLDDIWIGKKPDQNVVQTKFIPIKVTGSSLITTNADGETDLSKVPSNTLIDIDIDVQFQFTPNSTTTANDLYLSYVTNGKSGNTQYTNHPFRTSLTAQILVYDYNQQFTPIWGSPLYNFTNSIQGNNPSGPSYWFNYSPAIDTPVETILGHFVKQGNTYVFKSDTGNNTFRLSLKDFPRRDKVMIYLRLMRPTQASLSGYDRLWTTNNMHPDSVSSNGVIGWVEGFYDKNQYSLSATWPSAVTSNVTITKQMLLKTENSPADYLLSFSKLFGLYFVKDIDSKTIRIYTRNNFFKNEIEDWSDRIDWSKDFSITPILFDKKWYTMKAETPETYYATKYDKEYNITYGQKRMDTGYNFNSENTDLYGDNIYENAIPARDVDKYYRTFRNKSGVEVPCFMNDNITYSLFRTTQGTIESAEQDLYAVNFIDPSKTTNWYSIPGNDVLPKLCFFTLDNNEQNLEEISSALVFYNGRRYLEDVNGNVINYWITDDITEMSLLNDGDACYLWTNSEYGRDGKRIAYKLNTLPQFTRYIYNNNFITTSLDFGVPKEIYIDNLSYDEDSTIFNNFWKKFYDDQFDVNTRKVTCFVKLDDLDVKYDLLRKFYYFNDAYWVLNKINGYDLNSDATTRCEFIKVQDIVNYTSGVAELGEYILFDKNDMVVDYKAGEVTVVIKSNVSWELGWYNTLKITDITPTTGGPGEVAVRITYNENTGYDYYNFYARITQIGKFDGPSIDICQLPSPSRTVVLSGKITDSKGNPLDDAMVLASNSNFTNVRYTGEDGNYSIYVQKGVQFELEYRNSDESVIKKENLTLNSDTIKNITL